MDSFDVKINEDQYASQDGRWLLNAAEWWDERLGGTRHGWTLSLDGRPYGGKYVTVAEAERAADNG